MIKWAGIETGRRKRFGIRKIGGGLLMLKELLKDSIVPFMQLKAKQLD
ncbi:hypothetical protein NST17_17445 [Caldifermentibacillus hisashii]|uniref:Uncharacterized protein n=1 Tax=Caldifermentibacillus hisashii TaxID=996558 RepID=A0ABU9K1G4_9BACI